MHSIFGLSSGFTLVKGATNSATTIFVAVFCWGSSVLAVADCSELSAHLVERHTSVSLTNSEYGIKYS